MQFTFVFQSTWFGIGKAFAIDYPAGLLTEAQLDEVETALASGRWQPGASIRIIR